MNLYLVLDCNKAICKSLNEMMHLLHYALCKKSSYAVEKDGKKHVYTNISHTLLLCKSLYVKELVQVEQVSVRPFRGMHLQCHLVFHSLKEKL